MMTDDEQTSEPPPPPIDPPQKEGLVHRFHGTQEAQRVPHNASAALLLVERSHTCFGEHHCQNQSQHSTKQIQTRAPDCRGDIKTSYVPGSTLPSSSSSEAPPPVEMWLILSARPAFSTAATLSPPPMMVMPSSLASVLAMANVPTAN